jgi:hypothetical protein
MAVWTVIGSSEFDASFSQQAEALSAEVAAYNRSPNSRKAAPLQQKMRQFRETVELMRKLENRIVSPDSLLVYVTEHVSGLSIFSLIYKNWRCLYIVDVKTKTCTALRIEWMTANLRAVEKDRHNYGLKLKSLTD